MKFIWLKDSWWLQIVSCQQKALFVITWTKELVVDPYYLVGRCLPSWKFVLHWTSLIGPPQQRYQTKSISSGAQYVILWKYCSHPSLVMYSFATPPIKPKLGQQIGGGLLIANHLDESLWWANQKHWVPVRSYLLHSYLQVHSAAVPFTSHGNTQNYVEPKRFSEAKLAYFEFSSSNFTVQDHIPLEML